MRYAGRQNAFDREAAHGALLNRINANPPNPDPNAERGNNLHENQDPVNGMNGEGQNPNQDPLDHADENEDMLLGGAEERRQHHARMMQMRFAKKFFSKHRPRQFLSHQWVKEGVLITR